MAHSNPQQNEQERAPKEEAGRAQLADDERDLYIKDDSSAAEGGDTTAKNWDGFAGEVHLWQHNGVVSR